MPSRLLALAAVSRVTLGCASIPPRRFAWLRESKEPPFARRAPRLAPPPDSAAILIALAVRHTSTKTSRVRAAPAVSRLAAGSASTVVITTLLDERGQVSGAQVREVRPRPHALTYIENRLGALAQLRKFLYTLSNRPQGGDSMPVKKAAKKPVTKKKVVKKPAVKKTIKKTVKKVAKKTARK